ncbi:MAG: molybdopterin molybdotransferase MoeA [Hyphomicrobium sp.]|jgi:molybdopterin molybdotransferase|nr:molybdopterin molybdotransferase MoeA [Hyphomicrobium sp.]
MFEGSILRADGPQRRPVLLADAIRAVKSILAPVHDTEQTDVSAAHRRVLVSDLIAGVDLPLRDSSAVDGFAVRSADIEQTPSTLKIIGRSAAGHPFSGSVKRGTAVHILTGGAVPQGADRVVMQEHCEIAGDSLRVNEAGKRNIRVRGEDVRAGTAVLPAGRRVRVEDIALAHAIGITAVQVRQRLRVGLVSTGDEVTEPGLPLNPGQIWDANRSLLKGLLGACGCEIIDLGIVPDEAEDIEAILRNAAPDCDLLVSSGGMSVGSGDYMRRIIEQRGYLEVWPLAIKPGKPVGFGDIDDCPILALPGNPVAAAITFIAFGRPIVDHLAGVTKESARDTLFLPAGFETEKKKGLRQFLLATAVACSTGSRVVPIPHQGPAMLSALTSTSGIAVLDEDRDSVAIGDVIEFLPLTAFLS